MLVAIDPGHGGSDPGAVYQGRQEKDDNLKLAMAVGKILEQRGVDVVYTRNDDIYETPFKKATDANEAGADYFISFHRNSSETPGANGVQTLVYNDSGVKATLARNINEELVKLGFKDLGIDSRPNLVVLKRTKMPAVLIETGFINNTADNQLFDDKFNEISQSISDGILKTIGYNEKASASATLDQPVQNEIMNDEMMDQNESMNNNMMNQNGMMNDNMMNDNMMNQNRRMDGYMMDQNGMMYSGNRNNAMDRNEPCRKIYRVQVGAFRNKESAERLLNSLIVEGFPAFMLYDDGLFKVQVGAFKLLDNAIRMESRLRRYRYNTYITI